MLRALVLALLLANAGFWAWRQGWLEPLHGLIGSGPEGDRDPRRLARQLQPDAIRVLPPGSAASLPRSPRTAASAPAAVPEPVASTACLEAGPYTPAELAAAQAALQGLLPAGGWTLRELPPGRAWWVAMGPFRDTDLLREKRDQLRRLALQPEQAASAAGGSLFLVIARRDSRAAAEAELAALAERGVRTARVVEGAPSALRALRVEAADAAQQATLAALPAERLRGRGFSACPAS